MAAKRDDEDGEMDRKASRPVRSLTPSPPVCLERTKRERGWLVRRHVSGERGDGSFLDFSPLHHQKHLQFLSL